MLKHRSMVFDARSALRWLLLLTGLVVSQVVLYATALTGQKVLLPVDILWRESAGYLTPQEDGAWLVPQNGKMADPIYQYEPYRRFIVEELRAGRLPLWNPYIYCGTPFLTNLFTPFSLPYFVTGSPVALAWQEVLKALVGGIGAYLFFRNVLHVGYWAATVGAWCFPLIGFLVIWAQYPLSNAVIWLPWLLWCTDRAVRGPRVTGIAGLAIVTGLVLIEGICGPATQLLLMSGVYFLWAVWDEFGGQASFLRRTLPAIMRTGGAWLLGLMLSAPQTFFHLEYLATSHRVQTRLQGHADVTGSGISAVLPVLFPYYFGDDVAESIFMGVGVRNRLESTATGYAGLLMALVLLPIGLAHPSRRRINGLWIGVGVFGLLYMLNVPWVGQIFHIFPFSVIRNNRSVFLTAWAVLSMGVMGLDALGRKEWRWRTWFMWFVCLLVGLGLLCEYRRVGASFMVSKGATEAMAHWFAVRFMESRTFCLIGAAAWLCLKFLPQPRSVLRGVLSLLVLGELLWNAHGVNPLCDWKLYYPEIPAFTALEHAPPGRMCGVGCLWSNLNMRHHLYDLRGYDAADPAPMMQLLRVANPEWKTVLSHAITQFYLPEESPILDMLNLRYRVYRGEPLDGHTPLLVQDGFWVEENPRALPRAFIPRTVETTANDEAALKQMSRADFNPREVAYISGATQGAGGSAPAEGTADIIEDCSSRVRISLDMQTPGTVVLSDRWSPGWKAFLDGRPVPVLKANYALRGVEVPAGKATLEFRYQPFSFTLGLWCLELAAGILLFLPLKRVRRVNQAVVAQQEVELMCTTQNGGGTAQAVR